MTHTCPADALDRSELPHPSQAVPRNRSAPVRLRQPPVRAPAGEAVAHDDREGLSKGSPPGTLLVAVRITGRD